MNKNDNIKEIVNELQTFQLELPSETLSFNDLHKKLFNSINYLINNDFSLLISILYRLDISENKLEQLLKNSKETSAGDIVARMIIERQLQKIETRKSSAANSNFSHEEKW